jgi:peroxiredoxin
MNKLLLCLFLVLSLNGMCQEGGFAIKGKLTNVKTPAKIYLLKAEDKSLVDSAVVKNGVFSFSGKVDGVFGAFLVLHKPTLDEPLDRRYLYLEQGAIEVSSPDESLKAATVVGSPSNDDEILFKKLIDDAVKPIQAEVNKKLKEATPEQQKSGAFQDELLLLENKRLEAVKTVAGNFVKERTNSLKSLFELISLADVEEYEVLNSLFEGMSPVIRTTPAGQRFAERLSVLKKVSRGAIIPDLSLEDTSGVFISLSSFRGNYVLIDVWASWCGPCRRENPNLLRAFNKYKWQNFKVVGLSLDTEKGKWRDAIKKDGLTWTQLIDTAAWRGEISKEFGLNSIPQNYLVDPNGVIIAKNLIGLDLHSKLEELFGPKN